nr:hypothetical protein [Tanacetum cinerariifolium]
MNQDSYNSNSLGFDKPQPPQSPVIHQPPQELSIQEMENLKQQYLDELKRLRNLEYRNEIKIAYLSTHPSKCLNSFCYDDDDEEDYTSAITPDEPVLSTEEPDNYLSMGDEHLDTIPATESDEVIKSSVENLIPIPSEFEGIPEYITHPSKCLNSFCYDDDDEEDYTSAITPDEPVLSTEEPDNYLSMGDEHLDTIPATESDEVIKSSVENLIPIPSEFEGIPEYMCDVPSHDNFLPFDVSNDQIEDFSESNKEFSLIDDDSFSIDDIDYVEASPLDSELVSAEVIEIVIPEVGGIDDDILLTINDDILHEKFLNVNLLIAKIKALNANPTPSFDCKTKSPSTSLNSLLEETNTLDNSLPEFETFCFDVEEISNGSPTTHSDFSLYASFIFDLSINPLPPAGRSDFYEFSNELIPFISPPEYECFLFKVEPNSRDFTKDVVEDISPTKEPQVLNALPTHPTLQLQDFFESNEEFSSTDDDSFSFDNIDYVEASPPDSELVNSEVMEIVTPEVGGIKSSNDNPILFYD